MNELVSLCIPIFNGEKYLKECLDSVLIQSYSHLEILLVDDGSTDSSCSIAEAYTQKDSRFKLVRNQSNLGLVGNWNKCLELATGEWIKFVFQDDIISKTCIQDLISASTGHPFVVCNRHFIFDNSVSETRKKYYSQDLLTLKKLVPGQENKYLTNVQISQFASNNLALNFIGEPTSVIFKKELVNEVGIFNSDLRQICDLEYWLRVATSKGLVYVPEALVSFRVHEGSTSTSNVGVNVKYGPRYIDPLLLVHEMVYSQKFNAFQAACLGTFGQRLKRYLKSKMFEAKLALENDLSFDKNYLNQLILKYPALKEYYKTTLMTRLIFQMVLLKRKLKNKN